MRIAEVIGSVTLSRCHPSVTGYRWLIGVPFSQDGLRTNQADGEDLVIYDDLGAGLGQTIAFSESGEAAAPFHPHKKPIDAYCAAILDNVTITPHAS